MKGEGSVPDPEPPKAVSVQVDATRFYNQEIEVSDILYLACSQSCCLVQCPRPLCFSWPLVSLPTACGSYPSCCCDAVPLFIAVVILLLLELIRCLIPASCAHVSIYGSVLSASFRALLLSSVSRAYRHGMKTSICGITNTRTLNMQAHDCTRSTDVRRHPHAWQWGITKTVNQPTFHTDRNGNDVSSKVEYTVTVDGKATDEKVYTGRVTGSVTVTNPNVYGLTAGSVCYAVAFCFVVACARQACALLV